MAFRICLGSLFAHGVYSQAADNASVSQVDLNLTATLRNDTKPFGNLSLDLVAKTAGRVALRGTYPPCESQPDYDRALREWCGHQTERFVCCKPANSGSFWDCHVNTAGACSTNGRTCIWNSAAAVPPPPPAGNPAPPPPLQPGHATRFLSWNVYYGGLAGRAGGIAQGIAQAAPEIASIQEMWAEKLSILSALRDITRQSWDFAAGGATETKWDGDILFRSDIWEHLESGMQPYGERGLSWAALRRKADGVGVLVFGTHPICCAGDVPIIQAMEMVTQVMAQKQNQYPFPVAFMGDLNTGYFEQSQKMLRDGHVNAYGRGWSAPLTFTDAWAATHPGNPNPSTIQNFPVRIDYVYFEKSPRNLGTVVGSQVWNLPGGSDHRAVSGDVVIR